MPELAVNGATIHYEVAGEGTPLVLISGLGGSSASWAPVVPLLADRYRVVTIDNRGTGQTRIDHTAFSIDDMADDVAAVIGELGIGPALCIGWSMGGSILQSLLINHADVLDRAVLLSTFPSYTGFQQAWLENNLMLRRNGLDAASLVAVSMPWSFTTRVLVDHQAVMAAAKLAASAPFPTTPEGYEAQAETLRNYDSRPDLPRVTTPTLVLVGAEDILTPTAQSVEMAQLIPGAALQILPRGGHAMVIEYPMDTLAAATRFLDGI